MKPTPEDVDRDQRRSKLSIFFRMADEGNVPGRPKPVALAVIIAVLIVGLGAIHIFAG
jgi:hypothetical protein